MVPANLSFVESWKEFFLTNQSIVHLDISNNGFASPEIEVMGNYFMLIFIFQIAEGLKENHSIMGLHVVGNEAVVDAMGFMAPDRSNGKLKDAKAHVFSRIERNHLPLIHHIL
jgi:hypothetical protein